MKIGGIREQWNLGIIIGMNASVQRNSHTCLAKQATSVALCLGSTNYDINTFWLPCWAQWHHHYMWGFPSPHFLDNTPFLPPAKWSCTAPSILPTFLSSCEYSYTHVVHNLFSASELLQPPLSKMEGGGPGSWKFGDLFFGPSCSCQFSARWENSLAWTLIAMRAHPEENGIVDAIWARTSQAVEGSKISLQPKS